MRTIDADALKELFSEVIGHIAKKPEMNGNLEHMIRASAMVIQMIDDAPTVQPNTTTHDSISAETGKNDGDGTSGDCISRQAVAKFLDDWLFCLDENCHKQSTSDLKMIIKDFKNLPSIQSERKTGRWIPCPQSASWLYVYKCSECGGYLQISDVEGKGYKANYCSYCGAKMEGWKVADENDS